MILAPATVLYAPLCLLSVLVGLALLVACFAGARGSGAAAGAGREVSDAGEAAEAAIVLLGQVAFLVRLASWPALYAALDAYVPVIPGAMCLFGVLQTAPRLLTGMELLEAAGLVVAFACALALGLYRSGRTAVGPGTLRAHMGTLSVISVTLGICGLAFLLLDKGVKEVSCCAAVRMKDAAPALRDFRLIEALGSDLRLALTQTAALALIAMLVWTALRPRPLPLVLAPLTAVFHLFMALATVQADLAPGLTGKPDHHCLYCIPVGGANQAEGFALGALLLALATFPPILHTWYRFLLRADEPGSLRSPRILWVSAIAVALFWGLVKWGS